MTQRHSQPTPQSVDNMGTAVDKRQRRAEAGRKAWRSGDSFENSIEAECRGYQMQGTALVTRMRLTAWFSKGDIKAGKSPPDFYGSVKLPDGRFMPVLFDAKSFSDNAWSFAEWKATAKKRYQKRHQLKALRDMAAFGGLAFALVQQSRLTNNEGFYGYPAWLVPLEMIENYARCNVWSVSVKTMDHNPEGATLNSRTFPIRGANWLPAAIRYAKAKGDNT